MFELALLLVSFSFLWLAWNVHRAVQMAVNYVAGYEDAICRAHQEGRI